MAPEHAQPDASRVVWASGAAYEPYVGRWSRLVARDFLAWLDQSPQRRWLDVGCGTGVLTQAILEWVDPAAVVGVDPSTGFLGFARAHVADPRVTFLVGDARRIPIGTGAVDLAVSGLVLNFVPAAEQGQAVTEMARTVRPGGMVAAYVWDYGEGMQMMRAFWDAAVALDPAAGPLDEKVRSQLSRPEPLADLFAAAGLECVETRGIDIPTVFRDFDDYWTPFLGGQGPAPSYAMSLSEKRRNVLRDRIRADLPVEADGSIHFTARAWAARGIMVERAS